MAEDRETIRKRSHRIAFCGASGTGKSFLAEWIKTTYRLPINPVGARSVCKSMGLSSPYEADENGRRAEFQKRLLVEKTEWESRHDAFVTDRTSFDDLVYTMLHRISCIDAETLDRAKAGYRRYTTVVYCPSDVFLDTDGDHTRLPDPTYQALYDATLWGLLQKFQGTKSHLVVMPYADPDQRKRLVRSFMEEWPPLVFEKEPLRRRR